MDRCHFNRHFGLDCERLIMAPEVSSKTVELVEEEMKEKFILTSNDSFTSSLILLLGYDNIMTMCSKIRNRDQRESCPYFDITQQVR